MSPIQPAPQSTSRAGALDGSAPSAIEYAIIALLIASVAVGVWKTFGEYPEPEAPARGASR